MRTQSLFLLLGALLLLTGCGRQRRFNEAERQFDAAADTQDIVLQEVFQSYSGATSERIGHLHNGYLHDGTFALIDSLDDELQRLLGILRDNCSVRCIARYSDRFERYFQLSDRVTNAEIPFIYKRFPPPWTLSEPIRSR